MALYDTLLAGLQNGSMSYDDAVKQMTSANGIGGSDYHQMSNLAAASTAYNNKSTYQPMYNADNTENSYYAPGGGGYNQSAIDAMTKLQNQAAAPYIAAQQAYNSTPTAYKDNGNGSVTASFAGGGSHTVTDPNAMSLLNKTYGAANPNPQMPSANSIWTGADQSTHNDLMRAYWNSIGDTKDAQSANIAGMTSGTMPGLSPAAMAAGRTPVQASQAAGGTAPLSVTAGAPAQTNPAVTNAPAPRSAAQTDATGGAATPANSLDWNSIYKSYLGRDPTAADTSYWGSQTGSDASLISNFINAAGKEVGQQTNGASQWVGKSIYTGGPGDWVLLDGGGGAVNDDGGWVSNGQIDPTNARLEYAAQGGAPGSQYTMYDLTGKQTGSGTATDENMFNQFLKGAALLAAGGYAASALGAGGMAAGAGDAAAGTGTFGVVDTGAVGGGLGAAGGAGIDYSLAGAGGGAAAGMGGAGGLDAGVAGNALVNSAGLGGAGATTGLGLSAATGGAALTSGLSGGLASGTGTILGGAAATGTTTLADGTLAATGGGGAAAGGLGAGTAANIANKVLGGGSGTGGLGGLRLGDILGLLSGINDKNKQSDAANQMLDYLKTQQAKVDGLYAPGSPEYNLLKQQMDAKDAAAGRNSQYGTRAVDLAAKIAQIKADQTTRMTTGIGALYAAALNKNASSDSGITNALGRLFSGSGSGGNISISDIFNLLKNGGSDSSWQPDTSTPNNSDNYQPEGGDLGQYL